VSTRTAAVDFHLKADAEHTWALPDEVRPAGPVRVGQRLLATDGDVTRWAVVDSIDARGSLLLRVLWAERAP
jgi:hypothetical protein